MIVLQLLLQQLQLVPADRPADNPCVTWQKATCSGVVNRSWASVDDFIPAIYTAWQWIGKGNNSGSCVPCSGHQGDFNCGYIFPCYADGPGENNWGHHDVCASSGQGCNTHLPSGKSSTTCSMWFPGKVSPATLR